jgi:hypothetical protein
MGIMKKRFHFVEELNPKQRRTFLLHILYSIAEGILFGAFVLNEFIFIKSIKGNDYLMGVLFMFSMGVFTLLIFGNEVLRRNENKKRLLRTTALITRLPMLLFIFFPRTLQTYISHPIWYFLFLLIMLVYYLSTPVSIPTVNLLLRKSYGDVLFGKLFGYANTINKTFVLLTTFGFGFLLDTDYFAFKFVYPIIGIIGIAGMWSLSAIEYTPEPKQIIKYGFRKSIINSIETMRNIVSTNRPFLNFEIGFFLYGIAFMITVAAITFYMEKQLHLSYSSIAGYKNLGALITIIFMPFFGRFIGKTDPRKFSRISYWLMIVYIGCIAITDWVPYHFIVGDYTIYISLVLAFVAQGLFAAGMGLLWYIGSAFFCRDSSLSADYQSVHLSFVGIRALFAPVLGVFFYQNLGHIPTFIIAIVLILSAIVLMHYSQWKRPKPYGD